MVACKTCHMNLIGMAKAAVETKNNKGNLIMKRQDKI